MAKAGLRELPPDQPPAPAGDAPPGPVPADPAGAVPRVIKGIERSPGAGLFRFKVRCKNYDPLGKVLYVLALDEASARAEYLRATTIDRELARLEKLRKKGGSEPEGPDLVVTALPD